MTAIVLHQYPESTFSEKIRLLLGYKNAEYRYVDTSIIMPRPDLMPLTGGYRKIPVMQVGADIYCDSALICKVIDTIWPKDTIYPPAHRAVMESFALWTDTFFFKVCVAVAFQPSALSTEPLFSSDEAAAAFFEDRAELTHGSNELAMSFEIAEPHFEAHLSNLDRQLEYADFLFGEKPTIADFSSYHLIWFVKQREALASYFDNHKHLLAWYERMRSFGHGRAERISGADALALAVSSEPEEAGGSVLLDGIEVGSRVSVMPIDYGFQPVVGELRVGDSEEIAIGRDDEAAGRVIVHFPRMGFQVTSAS